jgi:hypothetical protein
VNPGFESGTLAPWTTNGPWMVSTVAAHDGTYGAQDVGNFNISQTFPPIPVPQLTSASFWTYHNVTDNPAMSVNWTYSDNTTGMTFLGTNQLAGWVQVDILPLLNPAKSLSQITVWGFSGGGTQLTKVDTFLFCH